MVFLRPPPPLPPTEEDVGLFRIEGVSNFGEGRRANDIGRLFGVLDALDLLPPPDSFLFLLMTTEVVVDDVSDVSTSIELLSVISLLPFLVILFKLLLAFIDDCFDSFLEDVATG